jgi:hypothetical protein
MAFLRYLYRSVNILNIALLLGLIVLVFFVVMPLFSTRVKFSLPVVAAKTAISEEEIGEETPAPSPLDFAVIGENNLFHPERRVPLDNKDEKALPKPELVLYGTIIDGGIRVAYIEDKKSPQSTPGRGKRQTVAKIGDAFSGFIIKEIEADRIVLVRGEERMVVSLTEKDKQREGADGSSASPATGKPVGPGVVPVPGRRTPTPMPAPSPAANMPMPTPMPANPPAVSPKQIDMQRQKILPTMPGQKP